ncbi:MAG TPA: beta-ketoacyl synthase [Gammaproteobacteria bacterium]|jgi:acetoacetyl-[acyl-carrier protein] synthase|nr:beta-ketoacyl synthase [Gammaproteobacteria bacterium]MDP6732762.1 beta-ketoacyl synthase [Gammaproteobacteria bacterium]HAJ77413.1 beta-ketoacyl synthase [Gammaproteobacteria bacterium]
MAKLPVIAGFGGINPAGRASGHHAYRRLVIDALSDELGRNTWASLAALTGQLRKEDGQWRNSSHEPVDFDSALTTLTPGLEQSTLIRKLETNLFDPSQLLYHRRASFPGSESNPLQFEIRKKQLPSPLPPGWTVSEASSDPKHRLSITATDNFDVLLRCYRQAPVNSAGQLPSNFDPAILYPSRNHPRALQLTVYGASDAINSLGIDWEIIRQKVPADQFSVYAANCMGQLDYNGFGGLLQARLLGKKVTSKQLPLGFTEMPADFLNAYLLGNLGTTGANVAACATFLYNLRLGIRDIQNGNARVVIVGSSEACLVPEVFEGFTAMGALAEDAVLRTLDGLTNEQQPNYRRACRPFSDNVGFTMSESAQFVVLFDDELALELGANIFGGVNEVFVSADGHKKSIAGPGLGNYFTMAKAAVATRNVLGEEGLRRRSYVQSHGTGTPQNRTTESHILNQIAQTFGIENWPVAAIKSYLGHSIASASGDQLSASLGTWSDGIIPGILTVDEIAEDVQQQNLDFLLQHAEVGREGMDAVLINSKGFGGNNASASILAPHVVQRMLGKRHGKEKLKQYKQRNEQVQEQSADNDRAAMKGINNTIYRFDHGVLGSDAIEMTDRQIKIANYEHPVSLEIENYYKDMCD